MNPNVKRALLYGGAALAVAGLFAAKASVSADADVMTLLSSVDVQLRLAHGIPAVDKQGKTLSARDDMIAAAEATLREVERLQPGMAVTAEFVGFAHSLRGRFAEAAASYARARACRDCGDEQRDVLAFNQARMLAQAGKGEQALAVFAASATALDARYGHQRALEEAAILRGLGRTDDARARLQPVLGDAAAPANVSLQAGEELLALGDGTAAATAFSRAATELPIAGYHLAQLKLQQGDVDSSLTLLGRAAKALPAEVRRRLRDEADAWSAVAADARYLEITQTPAAPLR
jgi:hypothetical protein